MSEGAPKKIAVYRANQRHELGLLRTWLVMMRNVYESRELIWQLFRRDFFAIYRKSFIGVAWIFLLPLFGIVSWVLLKNTNILRPGDTPGGAPYTVYVLLGTTMWGLFVSLFTSASRTLIAGQSLVMQVNYRHEALLFQQMAQALARFTISLSFVVIVLAGLKIYFLHHEPFDQYGQALTPVGQWAKAFPTWRVALLPLVLLPLMLLTAGAGLLISMVAAVAVDVTQIMDKVMALLMMFSPVIYVAQPLEKIDPESAWQVMLHHANKWNPLTYLVCSARDIVLVGRLYDNVGFAICAAGSALLFLLSWRLFFVSEDRLIERMI